jgi:competence protein ComGC
LDFVNFLLTLPVENITKTNQQMNNKYEKPKTKIVRLQGQKHLLQASNPKGMSVNMSSYQKGGDGSGDSDGWTD